MAKISWCLKVKNGLELVEPNNNLVKVYTKKAQSSLNVAIAAKGNRDWEIATRYYAMYFALYSVLMRIGVKCENHSCTIEFMKKLLGSYFDKKEVELIQSSMKARIDAQYYGDRDIAESQYGNMVKETPHFLAKCKEVLHMLNDETVAVLRKKLEDLR
jgi:uncharacterized protein (UPF0332 family)